VLWAILYFTTPVLVFGTWLVQRCADRDDHRGEVSIASPLRIAIGLVGVAMVVLSVGLFFPVELGSLWPWALTPLTARIVSAMFALPGLVGIGVALDPRWSVARIVTEAEIVSIVLILVAAWRDQSAFDLSSPAAWVFTIGLVGYVGLLAGLYVVMERRSRGLVEQQALAP
jgi:hypothetical protein